MSKVSKIEFVKKLREATELPSSAFTGVEIAKVLSVDPISISCYGQTITSNLIYVSPLCESFKTKIFKHKHTYQDWNNGENASGGNNTFESNEELQEVEIWRDLKAGDEVLVIRTNESQKYIILCRVSNLDDR